ncbi:MAG: lamin tail domain-containing protein, partial [Planctomycetota bacterium]
MYRRCMLLSLLAFTCLISNFNGGAYGEKQSCSDGDLNGDCFVGTSDVVAFAQQWLDGAGCPGHSADTCADLIGNDGVNFSDFTVMAGDYRGDEPYLAISELMASNQTTLLDEDRDSSDWIEIYNPTRNPINLGGRYLTDDVNDPDKWEFPALVIRAGEHKVIFASGKNRRDPDSELHTNFELKASGEFLGLVNQDGKTTGHNFDRYPPGYVDISYGLDELLGGEGYFTSPSPGRPNGGATANLGPAIYNVTENPPQPRYDTSLFTITARVRQTIDPIMSVTLYLRTGYSSEGGTPMYDDGEHGDGDAGDGVYGATFTIRGGPGAGQMIRWRVTSRDTSGRLSRNPLFPYPENSPEYYGTVSTDPGVVTQLPVLHWFVQNPAAADTVGGTRASVFFDGEFYDNVFVRRRGGTSGTMEKKNHKFVFNKGYYFRFADDGNRAREANMNAAYADTSYMREILNYNLLKDCGVPSCYAFPIRIEQNSSFHSLGFFAEQVDQRFLERHDLPNDGPLYKAAINGTLFDNAYDFEPKNDSTYAAMIDLVKGLNFSGTKLQNYIFDNLDIPETISYLAGSVVVGNTDHTHKNYYMYLDETTGLWYTFPWDRDLSFGNTWNNGNVVTNVGIFSGSNNRLFGAIFNTPRARSMFLRRLRTLMDEFLQTDSVPAEEREIDRRIAVLEPLMKQEADLDRDKWGFTSQNPYHLFAKVRFDEGVDIITDIFLPGRRDYLYVQNSGSGEVIPEAQPESFSISIGAIDVSPASHNQDEEYIELINLNPFDADISGWRITGAVEHTLQAGTVILAGGKSMYISPNVLAFKNRSVSPKGGEGNFVQGNYRGHLSSWGETITLLDKDSTVIDQLAYPADPTDQQRYLRINEIMYHPAQGGTYNEEEYEYIELRNISENLLLLNGVKLTDGIYYEFATSGSNYLGPDECMVIVKNEDAFAERYNPGRNVHIAPGFYTGSLSNGGEKIKLEDSANNTILEFDYNDGWYEITDGNGFSLTIRDARNGDLESWDEKSSWRTSVYKGGSPGLDDSGLIPEPGSVVINEILAHSHDAASDWIELHNRTDETINIGGWFLSDNDNNFAKYEIAEGVVIDPCGYIVFYQDPNFGVSSDPGTHTPFALSENGEVVFLHVGRDGELMGAMDEEDFGASETGVSFGQYRTSLGDYACVPMSHITPGWANAYPKIGPVVITEIMYHPTDPLPGDPPEYDNDNFFEYLELYNITGSPVALQELDNEKWIYVPWRIRGLDYTFPPSTTIQAYGYLIVARHPGAFTHRYGILPAGVQLLGPCGKLKNEGERIELAKPGDEDLDTPAAGDYYPIRVDRVEYDDKAPWPEEPDGGGKSLTREVPQY